MFKLKDIFYGIKIRKNTSILIIILLLKQILLFL